MTESNSSNQPKAVTQGGSPAQAADERPFERVMDARLVLSVVATGIMSFSGVVVETAMNVTFPTLMREFGVSTSTVQWMTTAYLLVLAIIMPISSYLNKRFRTKRIFQVAMVFYISGILCGANAISFPMLLCGRILEGVGTGIALPLMFNVIQEQAPLDRMGLMMGIGSLVCALAPAVGPSLGGWIAESFGWRWIFWCLLPVLVVAFAIGSFSLRQSHPTRKGKLDARGWVFLALSFMCLVLATSEAGSLGWASPVVWVGLALFAAFQVAFVRHARGCQQPLLHLDVMKRRGYWLSLVSIMLLQFTCLGLSFLLPNYSQLVMGTGSTEAGSILLLGCVVGAVMSPISGKLLDRLGARVPILTGCVSSLLSVVLLAAFSANLHTAAAMGIYVLFALGQGLSVGTMMTNGLSKLPMQLRSDGNAIITTMQQLSGAVGTSVVTTIVNSFQEGSADVAVSTTAGTRVAYVLLVVVMVVELASQIGVFASQKHKPAQA